MPCFAALCGRRLAQANFQGKHWQVQAVAPRIRFPTYGGLDIWEFERDGRIIKIRVDGQLIFNTSPHIAAAAVAGLGLAYLPEEEFAPHIAEGRLIRVLEEWCPPFTGYHIYYPSRRQPTQVFSLVLEALRSKPQPQ